MAELSTACTPLRVGRALNELNLVKAVVDKRLEFFRRSEVAVERKTSVASNNCAMC